MMEDTRPVNVLQTKQLWMPAHLKVCKTANPESWDCAECCRMPCSTTKVCQGSRYSYGTSGPSTTETSGYRLLADLALVKVTPAGSDRNKLKADAEKRQNELLSGMSYDGFWSSTMDTAVALEALSTFAIAYPEGEANFMIRAWSEGRAATETIVIKPNNFTINANAKLDILATEEPSDVSVRVEGSGGTAYVNLVAMYNVNSNVNQKALTITGGSLITKDGRTYLKSCVQADPLSDAAVGTMIVSEITLQSGMVFVNVEGGKDVRFAPTKIEMDKQTNTAVCYFMNNVEDNFMNERCCYVFYEQQFEVQNQKPGVMRARDYYQTEQNVEAFYSTSDLEMECSECVTKKLTGGSESFRSSLTTAKLLMTMTMIWVIKRF
ncbi:hypothetical protein DPMN_178359 [Dreissena polymorpha]|uniref:Alpha-macroglobulin receptor-binding domain-containing protein n=1 Tax=Dreissena polymorpha TaxID=45954 RepID=A0A9D4EEW2_DREPO|nr:hypothetical protein DPMN_178359 [Dreissena polymorpha]